MKLGTILREYEIRSDTIRYQTGQAKGYRRADFTDAWARYCPADDTPSGTAEPAAVLPLPGVSRISRTNLNTAGQTQ